jgi:hypothetical protein
MAPTEDESEGIDREEAPEWHVVMIAVPHDFRALFELPEDVVIGFVRSNPTPVKIIVNTARDRPV